MVEKLMAYSNGAHLTNFSGDQSQQLVLRPISGASYQSAMAILLSRS